MSDPMRVFTEVLLTPEPWMQDALCAQSDPEMFFPAPGATEAVARARKVCTRCDVRKECLAYALKNGETHGIWGGKTEKQRRAMPRARFCRTCGVSIDGAPVQVRYCPTHRVAARAASKRAYQERRAS